MVDTNRGTSKAQFDVRYLKKGEISLIIPVQPRHAELIGMIVFYWGAFEVRLDSCIRSIHEVMRRELPTNFERMQFKRRNELFREIIEDYLPNTGQDGWIELLPVFKSLSHRAAALQWKRNVVAHGFYTYHQPIDRDPQLPPIVTATSIYKGRRVEIRLTDDILSKLKHDIAHLSGRLMFELLSRGLTFGQPEILVEDRDMLTGAFEGSFPLVPMKVA